MKKLIAVVGFFVSFVSHAQQPALEPGQIYTTPNIVQPTVAGTNTTPWVNGVYQDNLTCWAWGNPGYCGPNAIVRPGNNINFSFGQTDLYQSQAIANILPNSINGLRVNGYNFSFMAKNGNGWDDGRTDYLYAYTHFTNQNNQVVYYKSYNLTYQFNWTSFNYSETFNTPFASKDLKNVTYGFVGRDNNGWAGPYGPEIYNVSFSLKYSVDPCVSNTLYSPSCPGYMEALAKLAPAPTATTTEIVTNTTTTTPQPSTTTTTITQAPVVESSSPAASTPAVVLTSTGNNKETTVNSNNVSIGLSVVARNAQREQSIAMQASQNAIAAAEQTAQQAQQEAVSVAQTSSVASMATSAGSPFRSNLTVQRNEQSSSQLSTTSTATTSVSLFAQPGIQNQAIRTTDINRFASTNSSALESSVVQSSTPSIFVQEQVTNTQIQSSFALLPPQQQTQQTITQSPIFFINETAQPTQSFFSINQQAVISSNDFSVSDTKKLLTDRTNPINDIIENKSVELQSNTNVQQKTTVNTNASDSEIAGGVSLTRMAITPSGYNQYLNLMIADASFYVPKEIYRGQVNVDNVRALRSMSSDRLHQEMVNQQYRK